MAVGGSAIYGGKWVVPRYDALIVERETVRKEWAQIDATLQRRYDLIPNLVEVVGGFASHEEAVLTEIANAHSGYAKAQTPQERMQASYRAERAIRTCAMLGARYPNLRSSEAFVRLMGDLQRTEDEILQQRMRYNEAVSTFNADMQTVEGRLVSTLTSLELASYYDPPESTAALPEVQFDNSKGAVTLRGQAGDSPANAVSRAEVATVSLLERTTVTAIAGRKRNRTATLSLPDGTTKVVKLGDHVEPLDARVVALNPKSVLLESHRETAEGNVITQSVRLKL